MINNGFIGVLGKQVLASVAALAVSTFVIFGAMYLAPGDTLKFLSGGRQLTPEAIAAFREQFRLDDPLLVRYFHWLGSALTGDFGNSLVTSIPVSDLLAPRVWTTALLLLMATVMIVIIGVAAGMASGLAGKKVDTAISTLVNVGLAIPHFVVAAGLTAVFAVSLGWFPVYGSGVGLADQIYHLVLPAGALVVGGAAYVARITRVAVRKERFSEFVETAQSRGFSRSHIVRRHIMRNALIPITTVTGLSVAGLVASSVIVENAFAVNGLGALLVQSVLAKDFTVVQAVSLVLVVFFLTINLLVDLAYTAMDPRLRVAAA